MLIPHTCPLFPLPYLLLLFQHKQERISCLMRSG